MGAVTWSGHVPAALAGILEERLNGMIILGSSSVSYSTCYEIHRSLSNKITPWFFGNASAPGKWAVVK